METRGWDRLDILLLTGDAHVDHPSFGIPLLGRFLEGLGFRVGILAQPDWKRPEPFLSLGVPRLFVGISAGAMDSMVSNYTTGRKFRRADAYSPGGKGGLRPNRAVLVYSNRIRELMPSVPIAIGGVEASMRRLVHYDFWEDRLRRSILLDSRADILVYGSGEVQIAEIARRLAAGEPVESLRGIPGTAVAGSAADLPGLLESAGEYLATDLAGTGGTPRGARTLRRSAPPLAEIPLAAAPEFPRRVLELPSYDRLLDLDRAGEKREFLEAAMALDAESNPFHGKILVQRHGDRVVAVYPPVRPLETEEFDALYALPFTKEPHPAYGGAPIPAHDMIRFSIATQRGCFGGCTFCAIAAHQGRVVQSRSRESILREIEGLRSVPGFAGVVSDVGGPTANMYGLRCSRPEIERICRRSSCIWPGICKLLETSHGAQLELLRKARALPGIRKVFVSSGIRHDLALLHPEYIREVARHHVSGHLKVAPEHIDERVLRLMKKPPFKAYEEFRRAFERESREAGKEQYIVPYFISSFPASGEAEMARLMEYLKAKRLRLEQVQDFLPTPMTVATAMYYAGLDPAGEEISCARSPAEREVQKAYLRPHDPKSRRALRSARRKRR